VTDEHVDVAVVGGGPAGLAAAEELAADGAGRVVVLEREAQAGGIPRHAAHQGYGLRDLRRVLDGPAYARLRAARALAAGVEVATSTQVTGWARAPGDPGLALELTSPAGRRVLRARAVVLATGCRERPRPARLIAGSRPQGVMTTGMLQQVVHLQGEVPGARAVVVGAEHVSFSALLTLADGGARAVAMVTELAHHQSFGVVRAGAALRHGVRLRTRTALTAIHGGRRVEAVELTHLGTGAVDEVACDLVVLTADWIPEHELAVLGDVALDPGTRGPAVDAAGRTSRPGVFATGNLLHGAEPADVAALTGRHAAEGVLEHLAGAPWPSSHVDVRCAPPLAWIAPNVVVPGGAATAPPRGRHLLRAREELIDARVVLTQDERVLWRERVPRVMPGRSAHLGAAWAADVDPAGGPVVVRVAAARRRSR
jgi:thioredoxin reductase